MPLQPGACGRRIALWVFEDDKGFGYYVRVEHEDWLDKVRGRGVAADRPKAIAAYEKACAAGATEGCLNAARAYAGGDGVPRNPAQARKLYDIGCREQNQEACDERARLGGKPR